MPVRIARCTNFGHCSIADSKQPIQIPEAANLLCPECRKPLLAMAVSGQQGNPAVWIVLAALLLLGGGAWMLMQSRPKPIETDVQMSSNSGPGNRPILRLHGSNTIGAELAPALVTAFLKQEGATEVRISKKGDEQSDVIARFPGDRGTEHVEIAAQGSATAFADLAVDKCDLGMSSRRIKPEETSTLARFGDMSAPSNEHVIGLDGIAVIVSRSNPVKSLTIAQLAALFSGETTTWPQGGTVRVFARDDKSGTYDSFKSMVLGAAKLTPAAKRFEDSKALSDAVANDPNGIGFIGLPYIEGAKAVAISEKGAAALLPSSFTVATEDYPLSRRLYLYSISNPTPFARRFLDFAAGKAGQQIVADNGFVGQTVRAESVQHATPAEGAIAPSADYSKITQGEERLSLNFRFRSGSTELDNKALEDIGRVTSFLADTHYAPGDVLLLGFSDATGSAVKNISLSRERANTVAKLFTERGVKPGVVTGFGPEMPVASNETNDGREKNRRVEIWVKKKQG